MVRAVDLDPLQKNILKKNVTPRDQDFGRGRGAVGREEKRRSYGVELSYSSYVCGCHWNRNGRGDHIDCSHYSAHGQNSLTPAVYN
jgi:hypothetical protein